MPLLSSLGQHAALEAMQGRLHPGEKLFANLDDVWLVSQPERVGEVHTVPEHELWTHAKIQVHWPCIERYGPALNVTALH